MTYLAKSAPGGDHQDDPAAPTAPMTADCVAISIPFAVRTDAIDLSICPDCGGRLRVIADVTCPDVINEILERVARQQAPPEFSAINSMTTIH